jgi:hypothetical protein
MFDGGAPIEMQNKYLEAISFMVSWMNKQCYNEIVNKITINSTRELWDKITKKYASRSVVNCGRVFLKWSAITYSGNLQAFINDMRVALRDIEAVEIELPPAIISYIMLGKLMKAKELDQIVGKIAFSKDSVENPHLVLDTLQTFTTHHLNKEMTVLNPAALISSLASTSTVVFPSKVVHFCGSGQRNPLVTSRKEERCFHKYPHLKTQKDRRPTNASASFAHSAALIASSVKLPNHMFVLDSAATHHMLRDRSLFTSFKSGSISIMTGNSSAPLLATGFGLATILCDGKPVLLDECLFFPEILQQLISLVRLLSTSLTIVKSRNSFQLLQDTNLSLRGVIKENLLYVNVSSSGTCLCSWADVGATLWHNRLGHPSFQVLKHLCLPSPKDDNCNVCSCSKMTLLPFSSHFLPATSPLHCIHMDLVGPISPASVSGF